MRAPLAVGIVFAEQSGTALVDALERLTQFEVTALCDRTADDDAVRAHLSHESRRVRRVSELLDDEDVDAIVVAADPETTHELAGLALAADKHVLVSGLIAGSAVDAEALVQAAVARQRVLLALHTTVVDRATSEAKSLVAAGEVGDVYYLRAIANACTRHEKLWPLVADEVARIVDLLADEPVEVLAAGTSYGGSHIDLVSCLLRFANGIGAQIDVSTVDPRPLRRLAVVGSAGTVVLDPHAPRPLTIHYSRNGDLSRSGDVFSPGFDPEEPAVRGCELFARSVRSRGAKLPARESVVVAAVVEALQRSLELGGEPSLVPAVQPELRVVGPESASA